MANDDNRSNEAPGEPEGSEESGFDALLYSLADALQTKQSKEAIALLIKNYAEDVRANRRRLVWMTIAGWIMTLLVIAGLGVLAYLKLSTETRPHRHRDRKSLPARYFELTPTLSITCA
jgi:hypothetical protein